MDTKMFYLKIHFIQHVDADMLMNMFPSLAN